MLSHLGQTIAELEHIVTRYESAAKVEATPAPATRLDVLLLLPKMPRTAGQQFAFDDVWITVSTESMDRDALSLAGLVASSPTRQQGTESVSAEFQNAFLELAWGKAIPLAEKPARSAGWREGSPTGPVLEILPSSHEGRPRSLRVGFSAKTDRPNSERSLTSVVHPLGIKRVTEVRLVAPVTQKAGPLECLRIPGMLGLRAGTHWTVEITFDHGTQHSSKDLRPELPVVFKY